MMLETASLPASDLANGLHAESALVDQPDRPSLPIRVPVVADCDGSLVAADVIGSTRNVLLLQSRHPELALPPLGTAVQLRVQWDHQLLSGRMAAHGVAGRFLVTLGARAIRRSRRFAVDLPGLVRSAQLAGDVEVRVTDLSTGGARVQGIDLPVGSDVGLRFTPPGRPEPINVLAFVVRAIDGATPPAVGVAFRMVQPSLDVLGQPTASSNQA